jgi:hypothetical protein
MRDLMKPRDIIGRINLGITEFLKSNADLIYSHVWEECINHWLAISLAQHFKEYNTDTEYSKHISGEKQLPARCREILIEEKVENDPHRCYRPDIVIHERRKDHRNLLTVECKKSTRSKDEIQADRIRIRCLTTPNGELEYDYGLLVIYTHATTTAIIYELYMNGHCIHEFKHEKVVDA